MLDLDPVPMYVRRDGPDDGPVTFLRSNNATLLVKVTKTHPVFLMPITDKDKDPDVSAMLDNYGALEGGITRVGVRASPRGASTDLDALECGRGCGGG